MRILFFILMAVLAVPAAAQVTVPGQGQFRYFVWGVSQNDVRQFETAKFFKKEDDSLYFLERLHKRDFRRVIRYDFQGGKFARGQYEFQELTDPNPNAILTMYEDMKRELIKVYGDPAVDDYLWKDKTYLNHPKFWGRALRSNQLRMRAEWQADGTKAVLLLERSEPYYNLIYTAEPLTAANQDKSDDLLKLPDASPQSESKVPGKGLPPQLFKLQE